MKAINLKKAITLLIIIMTGMSYTFAMAIGTEISDKSLGNPTPMAFLVFDKAEPSYYPAGQIGTFKDGDPVSIFHETEGFDFSKDVFKVEMLCRNINTVSHTFKTNTFNGKNAFLTIDPSQNIANDAYSPVFMDALSKLPAGEFLLTIRFYANNVLINEGQIKYKSTGAHPKFKSMASKFTNLEQHRKIVQDAFEKENEEKEKQEEQARNEKNYYSVFVKNNNSGQTVYIVQKHGRTGNEVILEVLPGKTIKLELWRGTTYSISAYRQGTSKDGAYSVATVSEKDHGKTLAVR
jgi:hypothetical protein